MGLFKKDYTKKAWGVFATSIQKRMVEETIKANNFEIFEVRQISFLEAMQHNVVPGSYVIMFKCYEHEYKQLIKMLGLKKVF